MNNKKEMNYGAEIAKSLNAIDAHRKTCEEEIRRALDSFIAETGVRPSRLDFDVIDVSEMWNEVRRFLCGSVKLEYQTDVRFPFVEGE